MKARGISSFTGFAFIHNTFIFKSLSLQVKAVKAKNTTYSSDARVRAREKAMERGNFTSELNSTTSEIEKTTSEEYKQKPDVASSVFVPIHPTKTFVLQMFSRHGIAQNSPFVSVRSAERKHSDLFDLNRFVRFLSIGHSFWGRSVE